MPSRRELIQMTEAEQRAFLDEQKTITIVSNKADGYPHPMPMWFAFDPDRTVRMTTFRKSQKVLNVSRDPKVTLMAEAGVMTGGPPSMSAKDRSRFLSKLDELVQIGLREHQPG